MMHPRPVSSRRRQADAEERELRGRFKVAVLTLDAGICAVHEFESDCEGPMQAHHVVTQQELRMAGRHDLLWDPRNGVTVCEMAHGWHTKAVSRIPLASLPARCVTFAREHGFGHILDRHYP